MKNIGVTGAEGRVGRLVVDELLRTGYHVTAITMQPWAHCPAQADNRVADIVNYDEMYAAYEGCDAIIHLAGIPMPIEGQDSHVFQTNVMGVFNAGLAAGMHGIRKLVIASSDCSLGITFSHQLTRPAYVPLDEQHPTEPDNCYGLSKLVGEQVAEGMAKRFGMAIVSLRISAVLNTELYQIDWFLNDLEDPTRGATDNLWNYVDSRDCAVAFRLAVEADITGHEIIHITAADTRAEVPSAELIERFFPDVPVKREIPGHVTLHDTSKSQRLLGFYPQHSWRDGNGS